MPLSCSCNCPCLLSNPHSFGQRRSLRRHLVIWAACYRISKGVFSVCRRGRRRRRRDPKTGDLQLYGHIPNVPGQRNVQWPRKVEDKLETGRGDILLMGTINIPSQWDDGVSLLQKHNE